MAINAAKCGETIVLKAGAVYTGNFSLPAKPNCAATDWITITTNGTLPPPGTRLDPAAYGAQLARIVGIGNYPTFYTKNISSRWKLVGLDISNAGTIGSYAPIIVTFGGGDSIAGGYPTHDARLKIAAYVDRCFIHPAEISALNLVSSVKPTAEKGVLADVYEWWVVDSYIAGFWGDGNMASMGVLADTDSSNGHVLNNYIEVLYSNIFIGGSDMAADSAHQAAVSNSSIIGSAKLSSITGLQVGDLVAFKCASCSPTWEIGKVTAIDAVANVINYTPRTVPLQQFSHPPDSPGLAQWNGYQIQHIEIRRNTLVKRPEWAALGVNPKNWIELKAGVDVTIDGNVMTSSMATNIALTVRNQNGSSPWVKLGPVSITNNRVAPFKDPAFGILLQDNERVTGIDSGDITIANNLMTSNMSDSKILGLVSGHDVVFSHNTILDAWAIGYGQVPASPGFMLRDNIIRHGKYGLSCYLADNSGGTWSDCFPGYVISTNVIVDNQNVGVLPSWYPGNSIAANDVAVGFTDPASGNYRLALTSPYKGKASDGTDPGVDQDVLEAVITGTPRSTPRSLPIPTPTAQLVTSSGWGEETAGGVAGNRALVTNLSDSGPDSLRAALGDNTIVVFQVAGRISLASPLFVKNSNLTIDGLSAPAPGITIAGFPIVVDGAFHDVIIRGLRIRDTFGGGDEGDGVRIKNGANHILVDRVSISQSNSGADSAIDVTNAAHDVTVRYSILNNPSKASLLNYGAYHVSFHHDIFVGSQWRNPNSQWSDAGGEAPFAVSDIRDSIIWNWGDSGGGSIMQCGTHSNAIRNVYKCNDAGTCSQERKNKHIVNDGCSGFSANIPRFYTNGNMSYDSGVPDPNSKGNVGSPYPGVVFSANEETTACRAAHNVLALAGARPLDERDTALLGTITTLPKICP